MRNQALLEEEKKSTKISLPLLDKVEGNFEIHPAKTRISLLPDPGIGPWSKVKKSAGTTNKKELNIRIQGERKNAEVNIEESNQ